MDKKAPGTADGSRDISYTSPKRPNPVDVHVGSRVRLQRMLLGMSQEKLGDSMGLTFQQIQKYEKGINRIGASRLFELSQILSVPVQFFYDDMSLTPPGMAEGSDRTVSEPFNMDFLNTREGLELNRAFQRIDDARVRRSVVELIRALANLDDDREAGATDE